MKELDEDIQNMINTYWNTLITKNIANIPSNKFIKKPYLEKYIIQLAGNIQRAPDAEPLDLLQADGACERLQTKDNNSIKNNIFKMWEKNKIKNNDLTLFISNNFYLDIFQKKALDKFFNYLVENKDNKDKDNKDKDNKDKDNKDNKNEEKINNFIIEIILYQIYFFRFYMTIIELLYDNEQENNELYNFIIVFIKNKKNEIYNFSKNINFIIFNNLLQELLVLYKVLINKMIEFNIFNKEINDNNMINLFIKNIFSNWYIIYKKDLIENKVNDKIGRYTYKKNILSKLLCLPNI
jgi:hypothetical protein